MLDMVVNAVKLFFVGKLFRDNVAFFRQWGIAFAAAVVLMAGLGLLHPWLGMIAGGAAGGALVPWLFKDLKYH
jgi:hypothetical protein